MANITLYAENESNWFAAECKDKKGRTVTVDVFADSQGGAEGRLENSADDYNLKETAIPELIAPAEMADEFFRP